VIALACAALLAGVAVITAIPYSTGALFAGWKEREDEPLLWRTPTTYEPLVVYLPSTWLLQKGWLRGGGRFSVHHVPSQRPVVARG
jgi:hypothetical protein